MSALALTLTLATPAFLISRSCASIPELPWDSLGSSEAGIPLWPRIPAFVGSGIREYKPQALVSFMCLTLTHAIPALLIFRSCASIPELSWDSLGSSEAGILLWWRSPAFGGSGRREYRPQALVSRMWLTLTHATPALLISWSCEPIPELPWVQ